MHRMYSKSNQKNDWTENLNINAMCSELLAHSSEYRICNLCDMSEVNMSHRVQ